MDNIKRTRAGSKKKTKVTAADVKSHRVHAKRKQVEVTNINTQSVNPPIVPQISNTRASTIVLGVGNLPLPKKVFIQLLKIK